MTADSQPWPSVVAYIFGPHLGGRGKHISMSLKPAWAM